MKNHKSPFSAPSPWEAPEHGLSRIVQLDRAKKKGKEYRKGIRQNTQNPQFNSWDSKEAKAFEKTKEKKESVKEKHEEKQSVDQPLDSGSETFEFSKTLQESFFEEREPIPPLDEEEKREIYRLVNEYFQDHPPQGSDYLVSGAAFICKYCQKKNGSCKPMHIRHSSHGVYADGGRSAMLSSIDQIDSGSSCGPCDYKPNPAEENPCRNSPHWFHTAPVFFRDGSRALTMNSYTFCQYNPEAMIVPISSGQEYMEKIWVDEQEGNPIIIVPGIMGSRLYSSPSVFTPDTRIWEPLASLSEPIKTLSNIEKLDDYLAFISKHKVYPRPCENQNYSRQCYAQGSVKKYGREYAALDSAKELINSLCRHPILRKRRIYLFSYDWRDSNFLSAVKLRDFIENLCRKEGFNGVDLIGHSMGGLVISALYAGCMITGTKNDFTIIPNKSIRSKIGKIITIGTPYEGAPKLIDAVLRWDMVGSGEASKQHDYGNAISDFVMACLGGLKRDIKTCFQGVIELIPSKRYVNQAGMCRIDYDLKTDDLEKRSYESVSAIDYKEYLQCCRNIWPDKMLQKAIEFQNFLLEDGINTLFHYENAFFLLGTWQRTSCELVFTYDKKDIRSQLYEEDLQIGKNYFGDGTVPYLSSTMCGGLLSMIDSRMRRYDACHLDLIKRCSISMEAPMSPSPKNSEVTLLEDIIYILINGKLTPKKL